MTDVDSVPDLLRVGKKDFAEDMTFETELIEPIFESDGTSGGKARFVFQKKGFSTATRSW